MLHKSRESLLAVTKGILHLPLPANIGLCTPRAHEHSVLHYSNQRVEEIAVGALCVPLVRLGVTELVTRGDECTQECLVFRIRADEQIPKPGAGNPIGSVMPVHLGHRIVALGQVCPVVRTADLLVYVPGGIDRMIKLEAPNALRAVVDEGAVAFLALAKPSRELVWRHAGVGSPIA